MIEVSMVPSVYVDTCWEKVEGFAEKAAEYTYGRYTANNIYERVKDDNYQMWVAYDGKDFKGLVVTEIMTYPQRKLLSMHFCGGIELKEWKDPMLKLLQRYAKDMGCDGIESTGRPGWEMIFKNDGYKAIWVTYELPLGD